MLRMLMHPVAKVVCRAMRKNDAKAEKGKSLPDGVTEYADIDYVGDGARGHLLDVYVPDGGGALPLLVDIHGGALIYGYKEINKRFCYEMARLGFVVASVSYRLVPAVTLPDQLRDVTAALRWAAANAAEYGADADDAYLAGDSAGAFLALYGAATADSATLRAAFGVESGVLRAKGMLLVSGMYDMLAEGYMRHLCAYALGRGYRSRPWYRYLDVRALLDVYAPPRSFLTSSREDLLAGQTLRYADLLEERKLPYVLDFQEKPARTKGAPPPRAFAHIYPVRFPEWPESADVLRRAASYMRGQEASEATISRETPKRPDPSPAVSG